jgi:sugar phosphate isomerase/epimerase
LKLSITNLAFRGVPFPEAANYLSLSGFHGVEVAPSLLFSNYLNPTDKEVDSVLSVLERQEIQISALQSIFHTYPMYQVLDSSQHNEIVKHFRKIINLAAVLGTKNIVFGSPKNRIRGERSIDEANKIMIDLFTRVENDLEKHNIILLIEPNARAYGADYLTTYDSCRSLVELCASPWIQNQIDLGCQSLERDLPNSITLKKMPEHIHLSTPNLLPIKDNREVVEFLTILSETSYKNWLTIEMLGDGANGLKIALENLMWTRNKLNG